MQRFSVGAASRIIALVVAAAFVSGCESFDAAGSARGAIEAGCYRSSNCDLPCPEGGIGDRCRNDQGPPSKPR